MPAAETDVSKGYYEDYENACCESERHEATAGYNRGNRGCSSLSLFYNVDAGSENGSPSTSIPRQIFRSEISN